MKKYFVVLILLILQALSVQTSDRKNNVHVIESKKRVTCVLNFPCDNENLVADIIGFLYNHEIPNYSDQDSKDKFVEVVTQIIMTDLFKNDRKYLISLERQGFFEKNKNAHTK